MTFRKAFKFRLNTTPEIEQKLFEFSGCCRFVWNKALSVNLYRLENNLPIIWYNENQFWLGLWKKSAEYGFLSECHSQALQCSLQNLDLAFKEGLSAKLAKFQKRLKNKTKYSQYFGQFFNGLSSVGRVE